VSTWMGQKPYTKEQDEVMLSHQVRAYPSNTQPGYSPYSKQE
jgi:hypothetical protein